MGHRTSPPRRRAFNPDESYSEVKPPGVPRRPVLESFEVKSPPRRRSSRSSFPTTKKTPHLALPSGPACRIPSPDPARRCRPRPDGRALVRRADRSRRPGRAHHETDRIGPDLAPIVVDPREARAPARAVRLSVIAHGKTVDALDVGRAALHTSDTLDESDRDAGRRRHSPPPRRCRPASPGARRMALKPNHDTSTRARPSADPRRGGGRGEAAGQARDPAGPRRARGFHLDDATLIRLQACDATSWTRWCERRASRALTICSKAESPREDARPPPHILVPLVLAGWRRAGRVRHAAWVGEHLEVWTSKAPRSGASFEALDRHAAETSEYAMAGGVETRASPYRYDWVNPTNSRWTLQRRTRAWSLFPPERCGLRHAVLSTRGRHAESAWGHSSFVDEGLRHAAGRQPVRRCRRWPGSNHHRGGQWQSAVRRALRGRREVRRCRRRALSRSRHAPPASDPSGRRLRRHGGFGIRPRPR